MPTRYIIHDTLTTSGKSIHKHATGFEHILKSETCMQNLYACATQNEEYLINYKWTCRYSLELKFRHIFTKTRHQYQIILLCVTKTKIIYTVYCNQIPRTKLVHFILHTCNNSSKHLFKWQRFTK
jgi:hypothetical protein